MASQKPVANSTGPTFIQSAEPAYGDRKVGYSWLDTSGFPYLLKTWDGANWVVQDYVSITANVGSAGYLMGGYDWNTTTSLTTIGKLDFFNEQISVLASGLQIAQTDGAAFDSSSAGYDCEGWVWPPSAYRTQINKLLFAAETCATISSSTRGWRSAGALQSSTSGYMTGGARAYTPNVFTNRTDKLTFSTDIVSTTTVLPATRTDMGEGASGITYGYTCGAVYDASGVLGYSKEVYRLTFSTDAWSSLGALVSTASRYTKCFENNNSTRAYICFGTDNASGTSKVDVLDFATGTFQTFGNALSQAGGCVVLNSRYAGYLIGSALVWSSTVQRLRFVDETWAWIASTMPNTYNYGNCGVNHLA